MIPRIGHRGAGGHAPGNTLAAIERLLVSQFSYGRSSCRFLSKPSSWKATPWNSLCGVSRPRSFNATLPTCYAAMV
jgi:hypothetical protein